MSNCIDEVRIMDLTQRAKLTPSYCGYIHKRFFNETWVKRFCTLYQNILLEFESSTCSKPISIIPVEHCTATRTEIFHLDDIQDQKSFYLMERNSQTNENKHVYMAADSTECTNWMHAINASSYSLIKLAKEELEYRNMHLLRVIESERTAKWQLQEFTEEQKKQLESLRREIPILISKKVEEALQYGKVESEEIRKIKKIQSFIRGIICRRRWHMIVQEYIQSPHAESMRKRNTIVFQLVRAEEEYVECLATLVSGFYRPFKMAASSKSQPITHDEVNSIFLNSETLMFLHQIFLTGLQSRMESWPKVILGDLFDMLLPMLSIYQEYVRNHHYSLQTLTYCKQKECFRKMLNILEEKPSTGYRTLEAFLTYPMHRIPTYITTLQKLLSLTPFDHVERKALEHSQSVLEELSSVMHDEVSETENIRKNLVIERLFVNGCQLLLDSTEVFIRQGLLLEVVPENSSAKLIRRRSTERRESCRQCFLFSKIMLVASRTHGGKLRLTENGNIKLEDATLIEDIVDEDIDLVSLPKSNQYTNLAFKLIIANGETNEKLILLATSFEEKVSWTSDISQCIENLKQPGEEQSVSVESRRCLLSIRSDTRLFTDSEDIKYSRALDSCRLPRIRYATVDRLLERLLDVRFLSVEFLNTFLTTCSVFTTAKNVLDTIMQFYYTQKPTSLATKSVDRHMSYEKHNWGSSPDIRFENTSQEKPFINLQAPLYKHPMVSSSESYNTLSPSYACSNLQPPVFSPNRRHSSPAYFADNIIEFSYPTTNRLRTTSTTEMDFLKNCASLNSKGNIDPAQVASPDSIQTPAPTEFENSIVPKPDSIILTSPPKSRKEMKEVRQKKNCTKEKNKNSSAVTKKKPSLGRKLSEEHTLNKCRINIHRSSLQTERRIHDTLLLSPRGVNSSALDTRHESTRKSPKSTTVKSSTNFFRFPSKSDNFTSSKDVAHEGFQRSPKSPLSTSPCSTPGVVVTSFRSSQRRSSVTNAAVAFAAATAGATVSPVNSPKSRFHFRFNIRFCDDADGNIVTRRVLKILKHWVSKQAETFKCDTNLKNQMETFLLHIIQNNNTVLSDRKVANGVLKSLAGENTLNLKLPDTSKSPKSQVSLIFETSSSSQLAEQITLIDHCLLADVPSREFLSTRWMKSSKEKNAPRLLKAITRFNLNSRLISSEILSRQTPGTRANVIEKWAMVADACRCLHNFNGVLQIMTAFTSSAIFRLKKTWEKVSKQTRVLIEKLKNMVSADGRFRNLREALRSCDPPCVPYLGFYLTDLAFIEERTSMLNETNLVNFSKMKMVANVIQEIRFYQQTKYKIEQNEKILRYFLQPSECIMSEEELYSLSLEVELRRPNNASSRLKFSLPFGNN